jgi:hypothetical protein
MNEASMPNETNWDGNDGFAGAEPMPAPATLVASRTVRSSAFGKIALAMAKAQGAMEGALKDSDNPFFKSKYADLASVWEDCRKPLSENEIAVFQLPAANGKRVTVTTLLVHSSDQWIENELTMDSKDPSPQAIGSAISYTRRYALSAMVGVYQKDDDAEAAHGRNNGAGAQVPEGRPSQPQNFAEAKKLADRFAEALKTGIDNRVYEIHCEANQNQDLYLAAGQQLKPAQRAAIKEAIERIRVPNTNRPERANA